MANRFRNRLGRFTKKGRGAKRESYTSSTTKRFYKLKSRK